MTISDETDELGPIDYLIVELTVCGRMPVADLMSTVDTADAPRTECLAEGKVSMPGLLRGVARTAVIAGTATAVSNRVSRRQANRWAQQEQPRYASNPAPATDDEVAMRLSQLRELGELKSRGVLSEEEFDQQKNWILNQ